MKTQLIDKDSLVINADAVRKLVNDKLENEGKSKFAQFMTPASTASFMASLFPEPEMEQLELLDPGAGVGSLSTAFLSCSRKWKQVKAINLDVFEIDSVMLPYLNRNLKSCADSFQKVSKTFNSRVINDDFISNISCQIFDSAGLWKKSFKRYTHCIMNPPYKKILSSSVHRKALRSVGIETVNLYSGFVALSLMLLEKQGQLVAIIPRSFCNGPYYLPFREFLLKNSAIKHIHLFESRNSAFKDDKVLQENVIIRLEKGVAQGDVKVSFSSDDSFSDLESSVVPFEQIVQADDKELFIHIPSNVTRNDLAYMDNFMVNLEDIGVQVSTGPVVDFRLKEQLVSMPEEDSVPLLYPCHFSLMTIKWPIVNSKKPNAISCNEKTKKWLYPNGYYTVVRRFSSKEEKRRIVASVVTPSSFNQTEYLGFENHLNVFHSKKAGISENLARGLAVYLNCRMVDENFRCFSGHTQVNATDLRKMKYPDRKTLETLGEWAKKQKDLKMDSFDSQLEKVTNEPA